MNNEMGTVIHDAELHLETSKLNKSFCGVQGRFFQKEPLAAGGKKSNFMTGQLFFIITILCSIIPLILKVPIWSQTPLGTLHSINYPKVIIIAGNSNDVWPVSCKINYIYNGKSILVPDIDNSCSYDFFLDYRPKGKISYLTASGESLPGAAEFFKKDGKDRLLPIAKVRSADYIIEPGLTRGEKDTIDIQLLSSWLFKNTDIDEAVAAKSLSCIKLSIEVVDVQWKYILWTKDGKDHVQVGQNECS